MIQAKTPMNSQKSNQIKPNQTMENEWRMERESQAEVRCQVEVRPRSTQVNPSQPRSTQSNLWTFAFETRQRPSHDHQRVNRISYIVNGKIRANPSKKNCSGGLWTENWTLKLKTVGDIPSFSFPAGAIPLIWPHVQSRRFI
jgi:mRNA deadenylase 3'-5' endonuclease subunit Ccr4